MKAKVAQRDMITLDGTAERRKKDTENCFFLSFLLSRIAHSTTRINAW